MAEIENLSIVLSANAQNAIAEIEKLASSLRKFSGAAQQAGGAAQQTETEVKDMGTATAQAGTEIDNAGVSAKSFGDKLRGIVAPIKAIGKDIGTGLTGALKKGVGAIGSFLGGLMRIAKFRLFRSLIKDIGQSFKDLYGYSQAFGGSFAQSMDRLSSSARYLRNSLAAMASPIIEALTPAFETLVDVIVDALNWVNQLFSALNGKETYTAARRVAQSWGESFDSTAEGARRTAKEIKKTILGFDEINRLNGDTGSSTGGGTGSSPYSRGYTTMFEERPISSGILGVTGALSTWVSDEMGRINAIIDASSLALGLILTLTGANIPIGLGLIAYGAIDIGASAVAYNDSLTTEMKGKIAAILGIVGIGFCVGAMLAFSGGDIPLGIGLMLAGISAIGGAGKIITVNWDSISELLQGPIGKTVALISGATLLLGIAALIGGMIPLGIGLLLAGAAGLATTIAANWDNIKALGADAIKYVHKGWESVKNLVFGIAATVVTKAKELWAGIKEGWGKLKNTVVSVAAAIGTKAKELWENIKTGWDSLKNKVVELAAAIGTKAQALWNGIKSGWETVKNKVVEFSAAIATKVQALWAGLKLAWGLIKDKVVEFAAAIKTKAQELWNGLKNAWAAVKDKVVEFAATIKTKAQTLWNNLKGAWGVVKDKVVEFAATIKTKAQTLWNNLKGAWSVVKDKVVEFAASIKTTAQSLWNGLKKGWEDIKDKTVSFAAKIGTKISELWNWLTGGWKTDIEENPEKYLAIATAITTTVDSLWDDLRTKWDSFITGKWLGINLKLGASGESANPYYSSGGQYTQQWYDENIVPIQNALDGNPLDVAINGIPGDNFGEGGGGNYTQATKGFFGNAVAKARNFTLAPIQAMINSNPLQARVNLIDNVGSLWDTFKQRWDEEGGHWWHDLNVSAKIENNAGSLWDDLTRWWNESSRILYCSVVSTTSGWSIWDGIVRGWNALSEHNLYCNVVARKAGGLLMANGGVIQAYANGTNRVNHGTVYVAGEAGPEVVGRIGNRTEVMNKFQLAEAMYTAVRGAMSGVSLEANFNSTGMDDEGMQVLLEMIQQSNDATQQQNELLRQQNELLRQINDKEFSADITTASISNAFNRSNKRAGITVVPVGT